MKTEGTKRSMESRLAEFGARIDGLLDTFGDAELTSGLKAELGVWHEWIDETRLQLALGVMEGRDRVEEAMRSLEELSDRIVRRLAELEEANEPVTGIAHAVEHEFEGKTEELSSPDVFAG